MNLYPLLTPAGSDTYIQYNNGGIFGGDSTFTFNDDTKDVTAQGLIITSCLDFGANSAIFQPGTDSTTFFQVKNAAGTSYPLNVDSTNGRIIGKSIYAVDTLYINPVYCIGDSLTSAGVYETQLSILLGQPSWPVVNVGTGGNTTTQMQDRFADDVIATEAKYVCIWGGINDIVADVSAATIEANLQAMYTAAANAGIKVIAINISPFKGFANWTADRQAVLDTVNTWIDTTAIDIDYKIDVYAILEDPGIADTLLAAYDIGDHMHLSTAGYTLVGTTVYTDATWSEASSLPTLSANVITRQVIVGQSSVIYPFLIKSTNASDQIGIYHDNYEAYINWTDGSLILQTLETNASGTVKIYGNGTNVGRLRVYSSDDTAYVGFNSYSTLGYIGGYSGITTFNIQHNGDIPVAVFRECVEGETQELFIYGYRTGSGSKKSLQMGCEIDATDTASFDGVSNYYFDGSLLLGTTSPGTGSPAGILSMKAGTHPTAPAADCAVFFVEDVTPGTAEMRVMDEAGNESTLSPHNFSLFTPDPTAEYPWSYYAKNTFIGKEINVDMYGAVKAIEELTGKKLIYTNIISKEDWSKHQTELERERQLNEEVEILLKDAIEDCEITKEGIIGYEKAFRFDPNTGKVIEYQKEIVGDIPTGKKAKKLKANVRLDETTGKLYRRKTENEVIIDTEKFKKLPDWMKTKERVI